MQIIKLARVAVAAATLLIGSSAFATYTVNIAQVGPDVVMTGSGSLDTTGAVFNVIPEIGCFGNNGGIRGDLLCTGTGRADRQFRGLAPALRGFGNGIANTSTGSPIFVEGNDLYLNGPYVSGASLSSSSTFVGQTLAGVGLTIGFTRTLALPSGDTIVIRVVAPPVAPAAAVTSIPTLSEYGLMALASLIAMVGFVAMKRKRQG
ncbi:IPTL-CTERM sorting domain-containing protein [Xylophilus sp. Leaf220]|uniref:IPTL-CTERM sorting domain-containing protein n=1 Tax=Xylophilus sp. Leaf220 TaxID=1735686 RepID=UPI0009EC814E|nr:IPTL-CTERM sorting domain-containing protein [Xylophilus sp. Leaf220]